MKTILGSQSKGRKKMLEEMGIEFEVMPADIDEKAIRFDDPKKLVTELAKAKAEAIKSRISDPAILITSDQVVVCNGIIREKPESAEEAREFLASYEHFPAETVTSVVVTDLSDGKQMIGVDIAKVYFDKFDEAEIESIIDDGEVFWLAGAFDIDDEKWKKHIVRMEGTRDSVIGLPKELTKTLLEKIKHPEKEWNFGNDPVLAGKLFSLVVSGKKIAAVGLYEKDSDVPKPGDKARIINPNGDGFCLVEYVKVEVGSFLEVGMDFIRKEGEGDGNVEEWREKHRKFFGKETDDFLVVCEEFKLIEKS